MFYYWFPQLSLLSKNSHFIFKFFNLKFQSFRRFPCLLMSFISSMNAWKLILQSEWDKQKFLDARNFPRRSFVVLLLLVPLVVIVWKLISRVFLRKLNSRSFWISNLPAINSNSTLEILPFIVRNLFSTPSFVHIQ